MVKKVSDPAVEISLRFTEGRDIDLTKDTQAIHVHQEPQEQAWYQELRFGGELVWQELRYDIPNGLGAELRGRLADGWVLR